MRSGLLASAFCLVATMMPAQQPAFETVSIHQTEADSRGYTSTFSPLGGTSFHISHMPLMVVLQMAYKLDSNQIIGPDWINQQLYDISATTGSEKALTADEMRPMLQSMLAERFHLVVHRENRETSGYYLEVAKSGLKLKTTNASKNENRAYILADGIQFSNVKMSTLASVLAHPLRAPVQDHTGLTGNYEIDLSYAPMSDTNSDKPSIFTALEEQLGLHLERAKIHLDVLLVDHVDRKPTEN